MFKRRSRYLLPALLGGTAALAACTDGDLDTVRFEGVLNPPPASDDADPGDASQADPSDAGDDADPEPAPEPESAALTEARALLDGLAADGGTPFDADDPVDFPDAYNVFLPSMTGVDLNEIDADNPSGPTVRLPMFRGLDPAGNSVDYVITEASDAAVAERLGIIYAPRMAASPEGTQPVTVDNGIMQFAGTVDFGPERFVTPGDPNAADGPNAITRSTFPPADFSPGAVADSAWSSYVVLPSGLVLNAQLVANATGVHDRVPYSVQDDQNNPNLDRTNRFVVLQLLDGWRGGERYFFHLVTDASVPDAASIELGVYAPLLAEIPAAGVFPDGGRLGFSPSVNGVADGPDGSQGLNITVVDQTIDPVNVFPITPEDPRYTPMWDVHLHMWTGEAIDAGMRRVVRGVDDLDDLVDRGLVTNFFGNDGPENEFIAGLMPANAIINCPALLQPDGSVIDTTFGAFENGS